MNCGEASKTVSSVVVFKEDAYVILSRGWQVHNEKGEVSSLILRYRSLYLYDSYLASYLVSGNHRHNLEALCQLYVNSCSCAISFFHLQCGVLQLFILEIILEILFEKFKNLSHV